MHLKEIRRQLIHILYGPIIVILFDKNMISLEVIFGIIIGGSIMSLMVKKKKMSIVRRILSHFEREHHMENFPGRGILFYTIGAFLVLVLFPKNIAYAGILILSVGDAVSNIVGRHFGKIKTFLNPNKYIEGTLMGIITSIPIAYFFVPNIWAAISASCLAMFLEMPNIKIFNFEIDDNLIIPLGASLALNIFM